MTRTYKRKTERGCRYSHVQLREAVEKVITGAMSLQTASSYFGVPRPTIYDHTFNRRQLSCGGGGRGCELGDDTELKIAESLKLMTKWGFGLTRADVLRCVGEYVKGNGILTRFKDGVPGEDWFLRFKKKYHLSLKRPEILDCKRAQQQSDPFVVYDFYDRLNEIFVELNLANSPERIANCDETFICSDPSKEKVVGEMNKPFQRCTSGSGRENTTILACGFADRTLMPPLIIHQSKCMWKNWMPAEAFNGTTYACSKKGWMTSEIFYEWFSTSFVPYARKRSPCLLILDGHTAHKSLKLVEKAKEENITILVLPSHLSHQLQPLDKSFFQPFKTMWDKKLCQWQKNHYGLRLSKRELAITVGKCWKEIDVSYLMSGFSACGIFPLDRNQYPLNLFDPTALKHYNSNCRSGALAVLDIPTTSNMQQHGTAVLSFETVLLNEVRQKAEAVSKRRKVQSKAIILTRQSEFTIGESEGIQNSADSENDGIQTPPPLRERVRKRIQKAEKAQKRQKVSATGCHSNAQSDSSSMTILSNMYSENDSIQTPPPLRERLNKTIKQAEQIKKRRHLSASTAGCCSNAQSNRSCDTGNDPLLPPPLQVRGHSLLSNYNVSSAERRTVMLPIRYRT